MGELNRRALLKMGALAPFVLSNAGNAAETGKQVRVGFIGTGGRGKSLLSTMLRVGGVEVPAVCDISRSAAEQAAAICAKAGLAAPERYTGDETHYKKLLERGDLDAVVIATYWQWHAPMAVDAMKAGKYAAVEVPAALSFDECWALVDTHEETGVPCMMLENWSFRRDNLALLQMARAGLLGDIVHVHCAHSHDCIDHWFFDGEGNARWPAEFLIKYNRDQYPTHSLGPVLSWCDINCGDNFATCTSTATASRGINAYFARKFGPDHPNAKRAYAQGDIVTSVVRTQKGKSIVVNYDMQLPRPYDNRWMLQGLRGVYNEQRDAIYLLAESPEYHQWEPWKPYEEQHLHPWWKRMERDAGAAGHGGTDYLELSLFLNAVRQGSQTPIDIYDSVVMSSLVPLSEASIAQGGAPVACPDFTRGAWKTRKPAFGATA